MMIMWCSKPHIINPLWWQKPESIKQILIIGTVLKYVLMIKSWSKSRMKQSSSHKEQTRTDGVGHQKLLAPQLLFTKVYWMLLTWKILFRKCAKAVGTQALLYIIKLLKATLKGMIENSQVLCDFRKRFYKWTHLSHR